MRKRTLALVLAVLMLLLCTACGKNSENIYAGSGHSFAYSLVGNPDTLDPQLATNASAKTVLTNLFEGLLTLDADGNVQCGVAESYTVSDDGLTYTFHLRPDSYWYQAVGPDKAAFGAEAAVAVTADDFVFAFQRLFNPVYNSPLREAFYCIKGSKNAAMGLTNSDYIGVEAKDRDTLVFTLEYPNSGFLMLLTSTAALPCNQKYFESTKGRYGLDEQSIIGNGSFSMQTWLYDPYGKYNMIQMVRNPLNHQVHRTYPADLRMYIEETDPDAVKVFTDGSADCCVSTQTSLLDRADYHAVSAYSMTLGLIVNPDSPYAEPHVREALSLTLDRAQFPQSDGDIQPAAGILPPAVMLLNKSCRELIADSAYQHYDPAEADRLIHKGMRKLRVSEMEEGKVLCCAGMMDYSKLRAVLDIWLSEMDLHLTIEEVTESEYDARLASGDFAMALYAVTGENSDACSFFENVLSDPEFSCSKERDVRKLLEQAVSSPNLNDCVELYRKAEEEMLSDLCFIPLFYKQRYLICKNGVQDVIFNPFSGQVQFTEAKYFEDTVAAQLP